MKFSFSGCNICRNVGKPSPFYAAYSRKPMLYIELQPRKPKDKECDKEVIFFKSL
jgi:hypothetical protein